MPFWISHLIISQPLLLLWIAASVIIIEGGPTTCPPTHFVKYSSSSGPNRKIVGCRLCPDCSEGQGLSIPCGSQITDNTNIECVTCQETKTYSDSHGIENCKPCQQCGSRNVMQECTLTHNRKCGNETSTATTASIGSTPNTTDSGVAKLSTATTTSIESTATAARNDPYHSTTAERSDSTVAYASAVPATIAIVLAIALIAILCRRKINRDGKCPQPTPGIELPEDVTLEDFPSDAQDCISKLDFWPTALKKNWRHVAYSFGLSKQEVQNLELDYMRPGGSPTLSLIDKLCTNNVSLKRFVDVLREIGRHDVAEDILKWFSERKY